MYVLYVRGSGRGREGHGDAIFHRPDPKIDTFNYALMKFGFIFFPMDDFTRSNFPRAWPMLA